MIVPNQPEVETLSIRTFGGVAIELWRTPTTAVATADPDHRRVQFRTRTVDALLLYLACQGQPLSRDTLAELLWPERSQEQARTNLRVAIHRLRQPLEPYLLITRQSVALNPDATISVDVAQFEAHLAAGQLIAATEIYRGDFLEGFYRDGSPEFEQWMLVERERLRNLAIAAYQQLISQTTAGGQHDAAIASAQRLLQLDSLHEPTHRQLMRLLAQAGQRNAALAQFEICRQLLTSELDVAPDEMTTALYEEIRINRSGFESLDDFPRTIGLSTPTSAHNDQEQIISDPKLHNLPFQPTPFLGRSVELAQIESLLANPDCRLLTVLGVGGIGKTRLALEAARRILDSGTAWPHNTELQIQHPRFSDGVCFVSLASVGTADLVLVTLAQSLGLQTTSSNLQAEIASYLRPRALLLLLDNFEHLLEATDTVAYLLQNAPAIKVLVASRERLYLREEWLLPVAGLSLAEGLGGEAGQLFVRSAQRVQPGFTGNGQEQAIAEVCQQVEGMPLALELAASWVRVMPCDEIARQIEYNSTFLTTSLRNLPERHRSLRALFDQSWRLLSPLEQGVLMRLSVFAGGWLLEESATVTGTTLALLLGLVDKSLVRVNGQNRFDLHELVRQYAAEQLAASGENDLMRQRHYAAYLHLFRTADSHFRGPDAAAWIARLQLEQENLRGALQWAFDGARYEDMAWLVIAVHCFWFIYGLSFEGARWLVQLLPHRQALNEDLRLATLLTFYVLATALEEEQPLSHYANELKQLRESSSVKLLQAGVWVWLSGSTSDVSRSTALERAIALARASGESSELGSEYGAFADRDFILATYLCGYAGFLISQGEIARAAPIATEGLELFQMRGDRAGICDGLGNLGRLALLQGDLVQAQSLFKEAVTITTALNSRNLLCEWQPFLGLVTLYSGDAAEARRLLSESLRLCLEEKNRFFLARVTTYLAEVDLWEGDLDQAEQWLVMSLGYHAVPQEITIYQIEQLFIAARLAVAQRQYWRAATLFGLAEQVHCHIHNVLAGPLRARVDAALATLQVALEPEVFAAAFTIGQQLSLDKAFATILASAAFTNTDKIGV